MVMTLIFLVIAVVWLAYSNGANDNFKGIATLFGSGTTSYRKAISWATATTFSGSLAAIYFGTELVKTFSGKGLVPDATVGDPLFLLAIGIGSASTVFLATRTGLPVSTTHSLTGSIVGAGLLATGGDIRWEGLGEKFVLPLLVSPFLALILGAALATIGSRLPFSTVTDDDACLCVGEDRALPLVPVGAGSDLVTTEAATGVVPSAVIGTRIECLGRYGDSAVWIDTRSVIDWLHYLSAGAVGFARGLNDTPKVVSIMVTARMMEIPWALVIVGVAMALGGILSAGRVAETMSHGITEMDRHHGFLANAVTSFLVIFASRWGMPVSTTHVSCGSLFGIGLVNGGARWKTIAGIFLAWVTTLPLAAAISGAVMAIGNVIFS